VKRRQKETESKRRQRLEQMRLPPSLERSGKKRVSLEETLPNLATKIKRRILPEGG